MSIPSSFKFLKTSVVIQLQTIRGSLKSRKVSSDPDDKFVFPGSGKTGYNVEPRKVMKKIIESSEVIFTLHDLRRTFITVAESLDISAYALKRLLNHKMKTDVTAGYIIMDVERLRKPMQQITDQLLKLVGLKKSKNHLTTSKSKSAIVPNLFICNDRLIPMSDRIKR